MKSEIKLDYINYRVSKSREILEDAKLLAQNGRWNSCVNRLYYSCFYMVSALLFSEDIKAETHNGVKAQFFKFFVKSEKISVELGKLYSHLFDWRQETDYADFIEFDQDIVEPIISEVEVFITRLQEFIS